MPEGDTISPRPRSSAPRSSARSSSSSSCDAIRVGKRGPEPGATITAVESNGKHLLVHFDDGHVLHTHMQMTGAWQVYTPGQRWRRPGHTARVIVRVDSGTSAVCFRRRSSSFAAKRAEVTADRASRMLERLGPDLCEPEVDMEAVVARLATLDPDTELAAALLDQRVAAGIGNVFKSEVCWAERIFPFTPIGAIGEAERQRVYRPRAAS